MGFSMSSSSFVGMGFIPSVTKTKWKRAHAHRDIETEYFGIQSKKVFQGHAEGPELTQNLVSGLEELIFLVVIKEML